MAQAIICDVCETAAADFLVTNMLDGSTFAACGRDYMEFMRAMVKAAPAETGDGQPETPEGDAAEVQGEGTDATSPNGTPKSSEETHPEETEHTQPADDTSVGVTDE